MEDISLEYVNISIPKEYIVQDGINGQCGSCRFKQDIKCLLFNKETLYTEEIGAIRLTECPFEFYNKPEEGTNKV